ncbi:MAG: preprotein translocase subunit SecE [Candidatus Kapabacteria bacterium]|nr:preprotein translocase subunit SecE [Candidatus Kapabacteria bacterium]
MVGKIKKFTGEVVSEMKKVSWPSREQLRESTIVVVVVTGILTVFTFIIDEIMTFFMKSIF